MKFLAIGMFLVFGLTFLIIPPSVLAHEFTECWDANKCCCAKYEDCIARPDHPKQDPRCQGGHKIVDMVRQGGFLDCINIGCAWFTSCVPDYPDLFGATPEIANGIDDDCDGYIDDEHCDGVDNDSDGAVDEDLGSCLLKILFVPLDWQGTQAEFEQKAKATWDTFAVNLNLDQCGDNFKHMYLNVDTDKLASPACSNTNCGIGDVITEIKNRFGSMLPDYDVTIAITDHEICGTIEGCAAGLFIWAEVGNLDEPVVAHELGHIFGLTDEYCSRLAGSTDPRCNTGPPPDPIPADWPWNFLGTDLSCDPRDEEGCCGEGFLPGCNVVNYGVCCEGNRNPGHGRCIMSYANAEGPRSFDSRCFDHLKNPPNPRSLANPTGDAPMDCSFTHLGSQPIFSLTYDLNQDGHMSVSNAWAGYGRIGMKGPVNSPPPLPGESRNGTYGILIRDLSGNVLHHSEEKVYFGYEGPMRRGVDYSDLVYTHKTMSLRVPIPQEATGPFTVTALKDGVITSQNCIVKSPTGTSRFSPLTSDTTPPTIECPQSYPVECNVPGGMRSDSQVMASFFNYPINHTTDDCDIDPRVTNDAPALLHLGNNPVTFTSRDVSGNSGTCQSSVIVSDTTSPLITCPSGITVECTSIGGIPASDSKIANFLQGVSARDICDANLHISNNSPAFFPLGNTPVIFTAQDSSGNRSSCQAVVHVIDTKSPILTVKVNPNILWPPDHRMVLINPTITVSDICSRSPAVSLKSISMNENDEAIGDGDTRNDIQINSNKQISLRAERSGTGTGRIYTLIYTATDDSGNNTQSSATVTVPKNR